MVLQFLHTYLPKVNFKVCIYGLHYYSMHYNAILVLLACQTNGLSTTQVPFRGKRVVYCCFVIIWSMYMAWTFYIPDGGSRAQCNPCLDPLEYRFLGKGERFRAKFFGLLEVPQVPEADFQKCFQVSLIFGTVHL